MRTHLTHEPHEKLFGHSGHCTVKSENGKDLIQAAGWIRAQYSIELKKHPSIHRLRIFFSYLNIGYLIAKRAKEFCSGEDINFDFC